MSQDKKTEEKDYLSKFVSSKEGLNWINQNNLIKLTEEESPDFVYLTSDGKRIGLEVTQFIVKSKHGQAVLSLMRIGNKLCSYIYKTYDLRVSITVDRFDREKWCWKTPQEYRNHILNPGFTKTFNEDEINEQLKPRIKNDIEQIKKQGLIKETVFIDNEYLTFTISLLHHVNWKYDCFVNNESYSKQDEFDELRERVNKKNKKYNEYLNKCDKCFLLIYSPSVAKGNYSYFTDDIYNEEFPSDFDGMFLYDENENKIFKLKKSKCIS